MMGLPKYIDLPGSGVPSPPFTMSGLNAQTFVLNASYDKLTKATDQWLNSMPGSPLRFAPLLPYVMCTPVWIDRIRSRPELGWTRESSFGFGWVVAAFRGSSFDHLALAMGYQILSNPVSFLNGREIFGLRNVFGELTYTAGTYQPVGAFTFVLAAPGADQELEMLQVAAINLPPGWPHATRQAEWEDLKQVLAVTTGNFVLSVDVGIDHLIALFKTQTFPMVNLLEVRDAEDPQSAGYQALIESPIQITDFRSAWLLPPGFTLSLSNYASYPFVTDLGIQTDSNGVATPVFSYQCNFDGTLQPGKVLAVAGRTESS